MAETIAAELAKGVKKDANKLIIFGILTIVLGVLAMGAPMMTGMTVSIMVGFLMIAAGVFRTLFAFSAQSWGKGVLAFVLGVLTILAGVWLLARPLQGVLTLTLILAAYFVVDGIFEIIEAFQLKPLQGWGWMLFGGIVSLLLGWMIWRQWPVSGAWAIGILVGIKLIFAGSSMFFIGMAGRTVVGAAQDAVEEVKEEVQDQVSE